MPTMTETRIKGEAAIYMAAMRANELGFIVSRPITEGPRYDLLLDKEEKDEHKNPVKGQILRAQVKWGDGKCKCADGVVVVNLKRCNNGTQKIRLYKEHEVDMLLVYLPKINRVCCFPLEVFANKNSISIRIAPSANKQKKKCLMAEDYLW